MNLGMILEEVHEMAAKLAEPHNTQRDRHRPSPLSQYGSTGPFWRWRLLASRASQPNRSIGARGDI
jgi:hypothetical protein